MFHNQNPLFLFCCLLVCLTVSCNGSKPSARSYNLFDGFSEAERIWDTEQITSTDFLHGLRVTNKKFIARSPRAILTFRCFTVEDKRIQFQAKPVENLTKLNRSSQQHGSRQKKKFWPQCRSIHWMFLQARYDEVSIIWPLVHRVILNSIPFLSKAPRPELRTPANNRSLWTTTESRPEALHGRILFASAGKCFPFCPLWNREKQESCRSSLAFSHQSRNGRQWNQTNFHGNVKQSLVQLWRKKRYALPERAWKSPGASDFSIGNYRSKTCAAYLLVFNSTTPAECDARPLDIFNNRWSSFWAHFLRRIRRPYWSGKRSIKPRLPNTIGRGLPLGCPVASSAR